MPLIEALSLGQFCPGDTPLHKLSPGLKLVALPACVITSFVYTEPVQLIGLAAWAVFLAVLAGQGSRICKSGLWQLRYLFLVTVLLHTVLSPGHTLFGLSWLSLDGLFLGLRITAQLALAVVFSSLLTLTTLPIDLVRSLERVFALISFRKAWSREIVLFLSLILYFIPVLSEEANSVAKRFDVSRDEGPRDRGLLNRARAAAEMVQPLLFGLVDRADALAQRLAGGEQLFDPRQVLEGDRYPLFVQFLVGLVWATLIGVVVGVLA